MGKLVYVRNKKTKPYEKGWWPEKKRTEAVVAWLSTGSLPIAAATINVPLETLRTWRKQQWWKEVASQIQEEDNQQLDSKLSKIIGKTLDTINDRLDNGDYQYDPKTGRMIRIPVKLRDTHRVMSDLVDKRHVLRKEPTTIAAQETINDRLVKLAEQFAQMALGKKKDVNDDLRQVGEIYEGDWTDAEQNNETSKDNASSGTQSEICEESEHSCKSSEGI